MYICTCGGMFFRCVRLMYHVQESSWSYVRGGNICKHTHDVTVLLSRTNTTQTHAVVQAARSRLLASRAVSQSFRGLHFHDALTSLDAATTSTNTTATTTTPAPSGTYGIAQTLSLVEDYHKIQAISVCAKDLLSRFSMTIWRKCNAAQ